LVSELDMEPEDAEELKREVGVEAEGAADEDVEHAAARRILTAEGDALIDDIRGSVNFYLGQTGDSSMERIVIAGNGARLPHLANRMGGSLDIHLEPAKVLDQIDVGRVQLSEQEMLEAQPVLPTAVGLALWGEV
jgi:Tfp pilus assembly PilM family ATPase